MPTPPGPQWVALFPTSTSLDDLVSPFRENCKAFIAALQEQGATVTISATLRPPERCYLMHWSWKIAKEGQNPATVPPLDGVDIDWTCSGGTLASVSACSQMVAKYGIVYEPALASLHSEGLAIDMTILNPPVQGQALWDMGKSFGVIKLISDPVHWSQTGH